MKNICQIFITDFKRIKTNVVAVVIMLGLIILPSLYAWFNINPITHLLNLIRKPFLHCACPSGEDFLISLAFAMLLVFFAVRVNRKVGRSVIFYL